MRSDATVRDVMHREFVGVSESDTLADAAELLLRENADCLIVVRGGEPVGVLSPRDALRAILDDSDPSETAVGDVMAPPAPTVPVDARLVAAEERLIAEGASRLIATVNGEAAGLLTEHDIVAATRSRDDEENRSIPGAGEAEAGTSPDNPGTPTEVTQSICEVCGSLSSDLSRDNGQLVCPDCQEM